MLMDSVFTIREEALKAMIDISETIFDKSWLEQCVVRKVEEFAKHERFMIRIQSLFMVNKLCERVSSGVLNGPFAEHVVKLASDPVPNIRFNVSKTVELIYKLLDSRNKDLLMSAL